MNNWTRGAAVTWALSLSLGALSACDDKPKKSVERKARSLEKASTAAQAEYVGAKACTACHGEIDKAWSGSHHDGSLSRATEGKAAAPFAGERLKGGPLGAAFVTVDGKSTIVSGPPREVVYRVGKQPLQQYVVAGERGHLFAFPAAYDTRNTWEGGRRWFVPTENAAVSTDPAHYLKPGQTYNASCAPCHSTQVKKNYDLSQDSYSTELGELDVTCEACHGAGSHHIESAKKFPDAWPEEVKNFGFVREIAHHANRRWFRSQAQDTARLTPIEPGRPEVADEKTSCGPCHSASRDLGPASGDQVFADRYQLRLQDSGLFENNGSGRGATYALGEFAQSTMAQAGVVCSDCHNPHSTVLRKPADSLCASCHKPETFQAPTHGLHAIEVEGAPSCVDCHMPSRPRLGVDTHHDHRFSVPRPDLSASTGTSHACSSCHQNRSDRWAAEAIAKTHGPPADSHPSIAFRALELRLPGAGLLLAEAASNPQLAPFTRASALIAWSGLDPSQKQKRYEAIVQQAAQSPDELLRRAAALASSSLAEKKRRRILKSLWGDSMRSVRIAAVEAAMQLPPINNKGDADFDMAMKEARAAAEYGSDQEEGILILADLNARSDNADRGLELYELAAQRFPHSAEVVEHWVRSLRLWERTEEADALVEGALSRKLTSPWLDYWRGTALVKKQKFREALPHLKEAFELSPPQLRRRAGYSYAITVNELGDWAEALALLRVLKKELPGVKSIQDAIELIEKKR